MSKQSRRPGEKVVTLAAKPRRPCPICGRPAVKAHRPFCSTRCADADLGNWISGRYRILTEEEPEEALEGGTTPSDGHED
ncbi:MAG: DNA gyrase inhibitor YacG [Kiloniellales bacterium]|nr:DNA gyrase inhibitor YacG [Kiloniellales bacterium]